MEAGRWDFYIAIGLEVQHEHAARCLLRQSTDPLQEFRLTGQIGAEIDEKLRQFPRKIDCRVSMLPMLFQVHQEASAARSQRCKVIPLRPVCKNFEKRLRAAPIDARLLADNMPPGLNEAVILPGFRSTPQDYVDGIGFDDSAEISPAQPGYGQTASPGSRRVHRAAR